MVLLFSSGNLSVCGTIFNASLKHRLSLQTGGGNPFGELLLGQEVVIQDEYSEDYTNDLNPVVAWGYNGRAMIVWERKSWPGQLHYNYCSINYNSYSTYSESYVQNSTGNSTNPTIYHNKNDLNPTYFHLAWEEKESASISNIKYEQLYADVNNNIILDQYSEPSSGSLIAL